MKLIFKPSIKLNSWSSIEDRLSVLEELKKFSASHGYQLLSSNYINNTTILQWKDSDGIIFEKSLRTLLKTGWPKNYNIMNGMKKTTSDHLTELQLISVKNGGKLLSTEYIDSDTKLLFEDSCGNIFSSAPRVIKSGHWSPYERNVTEHICRQAFESLFKTNFPLQNDIVTREGKKNLQLDGYNDNVIINGSSYKIAFEYQGHQNHRENSDTIERDAYKVQYCKDNNIILFVIEPFEKKSIRSIEYIIDKMYEIINKYIDITMEYIKENIKIDFSLINHNKIKFEYWNNFGITNGFKLISEQYISNTTNLKWIRISDRYEFERSPTTILSNGFPPENNLSKGHLKSKEEHLLEISKIAKNKGGRLLSTEYKGNRHKLEFEDSSGNIFEMEPSSVKRGYWNRKKA